jgi:hypothetical protein
MSKGTKIPKGFQLTVGQLGCSRPFQDFVSSILFACFETIFLLEKQMTFMILTK